MKLQQDPFLPTDVTGLVRQLTTLWRSLVKSLSNVDNTADADKPVSTAQQAAINSAIAGLPTLAASTYAPTITKVTNATTATAGVVFTYLRVGNTVTVSGRMDVAATAAGLVTLGVSLPIASNLAGSGQLAGSGAAAYSTIAPALVLADVTNKRANFQFNAATTTSTACSIHFTYAVV